MLSQVDAIISNEQLVLVNKLSRELGMPVLSIWKFFYEKGKKQGFLSFTLGNEKKYFLKFTFRKFVLEWQFNESELDLNLLWKNCYELNSNRIIKELREKYRINPHDIKEIKTGNAFQLSCYVNDKTVPLLFKARYTGRKWNVEQLGGE